nr:uncharacterized protein LOC111750363 [Loxodonta africana]
MRLLSRLGPECAPSGTFCAGACQYSSPCLCQERLAGASRFEPSQLECVPEWSQLSLACVVEEACERGCLGRGEHRISPSWRRKTISPVDKLIGVHCTNGINRTGYLICRYLIDVEGWDPDTAIQAFGEARGHQIVGCVYLKDLKTQPMRSNLGMDVWDSDEDAGLPSNSMEKSRDWPPDEDLHGSGKKSRLLNNQYPLNDVQIKDYDYVNNRPTQKHEDFYEHHCSDSMPKERYLSDWDLGNKGSGPRCSVFAKH